MITPTPLGAYLYMYTLQYIRRDSDARAWRIRLSRSAKIGHYFLFGILVYDENQGDTVAAN